MQEWRSPPGTERNDGESTAALLCKTSAPVFTRWDSVLTIPSPPFFPTLMRSGAGVILHKATKAWCSNSTWYWTDFWPGLKVKFWFGVIYNHCVQKDCFQLAGIALFYCAHQTWYFLRAMTVTSMAVRHSFISSEHWTQRQQLNCL